MWVRPRAYPRLKHLKVYSTWVDSSTTIKGLFQTSKLIWTIWRRQKIFLYSMFLFHLIMKTLSIISSIKNFSKHVLIDHFYNKRETIIKRKVIEWSLQEVTVRSDNMFTMQCYNILTELRCREKRFIILTPVIFFQFSFAMRPHEYLYQTSRSNLV